MICVFPKNADDFTTNGLAILTPIKCQVTEELNGEYKLEMTHPIDEAGKWKQLQIGNIIKAPVPAMTTPEIINTISIRTETAGSAASSSVWVCTAGQKVRMHTGPGIHNGACVDYIQDGEEVIVSYSVDVEGDDTYLYGVSPRGISGYVRQYHFSHQYDIGGSSSVKTEQIEEVIPSKQVGDQPFRIYRVIQQLDRILVYANHLFYDLQDNFIQKYSPASGTYPAQIVAPEILKNAESQTLFQAFCVSQYTGAELFSVEMQTPVDAYLNEEKGFCNFYKQEIIRDWWNIYFVDRVGTDSNVTIREGKNLKSLKIDEDWTETASRIIPAWPYPEASGCAYLPELYVESPNASDFPFPKYKIIEFKDKNPYEVLEDFLRRKAAEAFEDGADQPIRTITVDYLDLTKSDEYKALGLTSNIYLGDHVHVIAERLARDVVMRMTRYVFDCLTERYTQITLGTPYKIE